MALASQRKYPCGICLGPLMSSGFVPLAWRNLLANKPRLLRSSDGIGFAVLLMLIQLGFERAFFNASLEIISPSTVISLSSAPASTGLPRKTHFRPATSKRLVP